MRQHPAIVNPRRWRILRRRILDRDGWRCVQCGKAGRLEVDHIKPIRDGGDWWDPANLQLLCRPDHFSKSAGENAKPVPADVAEWQTLLRGV